MDLQPVSPAELQAVEGGSHHKNDGLNLVAPYNLPQNADLSSGNTTTKE
jgi:hypothetical protein